MIEMETTEQGIADDSRGSGVGLPRLVRHLDLFSGIGGFALAARMVGGIETVGFCEIDPWARKVLAKNFPGVPCHEDVKTLNPKDYGRIDLISGGYPCQPFSKCGKRRGSEDDRHLWPDFLRIIQEARPRWVIAENVADHITLGLEEVLLEMDSSHYNCEVFVIPACSLGAPHRRDRLWLVGYSNDHLRQSNATQQGEQKRERGLATGVPTWWDTEPRLDRVVHGVSSKMDRDRNRGLGNAIVPQVAAEILRCMMRVDSLANA